MHPLRQNVCHIQLVNTHARIQLISLFLLFSVSPEELHRAKVLILDLLGWGVTPEYILKRGVSQTLLCSIFVDLKLRLPENIAADSAASANGD